MTHSGLLNERNTEKSGMLSCYMHVVMRGGIIFVQYEIMLQGKLAANTLCQHYYDVITETSNCHKCIHH